LAQNAKQRRSVEVLARSDVAENRIGVPLSEGLPLHPEQSTDAFVVHHPEAK